MALVAQQQRLLWHGFGPVPRALQDAAGHEWELRTCRSPAELTDLGRQADVVVVSPPPPLLEDARRLADLLGQVERAGAVTVVLMPGEMVHASPLAGRRGPFVVMPEDASPAEMAGALRAAASLGPAFRVLQEDLASLRAGGPVDAGGGQFGEELRLAARLQRDFMPHDLPELDRVKFASLFRPAEWVSGDIYDVFRLDESHVGFYVADVVGHGMPAALMTMFIKKALQTKRIEGHDYEIVAPDDALAQLNEDICQQDLSGFQFCTALYAVLDTTRLTLDYARGGHPPPVRLETDGKAGPLDAEGPLLGVFPEAEFEAARVQLHPSERLVIFSDGAEDIFTPEGGSGSDGLIDQLRETRHLDADQAALHLAVRMDRARTHHSRRDDITILLLDILAGG